MGRETKLLLALLATLAGVFVGVLSMKLLVARPPVGAGPDVDVAVAEPHELVAPPTLSAAAPAERGREADDVAPADGRGAGGEPDPDAVGPRPRRDPFVAAASFEQPPAGVEPQPEPAAADRDAPGMRVPAAFAPPLPDMPPVGTSVVTPQAIEPAGAPPAVDASVAVRGPASPSYVAAAGDSWWDLAERAYGDGRLYRALFAWNRALDPRVTLAPGTRLEIPARERLEAAWPRLAVPR
jgi:5'-nucleotidase/UDP-sugar diphosphatase